MKVAILTTGDIGRVMSRLPAFEPAFVTRRSLQWHKSGTLDWKTPDPLDSYLFDVPPFSNATDYEKKMRVVNNYDILPILVLPKARQGFTPLGVRGETHIVSLKSDDILTAVVDALGDIRDAMSISYRNWEEEQRYISEGYTSFPTAWLSWFPDLTTELQWYERDCLISPNNRWIISPDGLKRFRERVTSILGNNLEKMVQPSDLPAVGSNTELTEVKS